MYNVIFNDEGHGGNDAGAVSGSRYEKNDNLKLSNRVKQIIEANGIKVITSRDGQDKTISLIQRTTKERKLNVDFTISYHRNSNVGNPGTGVEVFYHATSSKGKHFAQ